MSNLWFFNGEVINCVFDGNTAVDSGGAMFNSGSRPALINCTFTENDVAV